MIIRILGSAAGGGFPQWNCNCPNCDGLRKGNIRATARTQSSIAVSDNEAKNWIIINASPDIRTQILHAPQLQPARKIRDTGIVGVMLVDSQIDHTTGLLMLREGEKLPLYCTRSVYEDLTTGFPIINILDAYCGTEYHEIKVQNPEPFFVPKLPSISFTAVPLEGKAPPYSPHRQAPTLGDNIALYIRDEQSNRAVFYAPGLAKVDENIKAWVSKSDCLLLDGTFWQEEEMITHKISNKTAASMGHLPQSGSRGLMAQLSSFAARKILIHINNTNPILNETTTERALLTKAGFEVAFDGLEITL